MAKRGFRTSEVAAIADMPPVTVSAWVERRKLRPSIAKSPQRLFSYADTLAICAARVLNQRIGMASALQLHHIQREIGRYLRASRSDSLNRYGMAHLIVCPDPKQPDQVRVVLSESNALLVDDSTGVAGPDGIYTAPLWHVSLNLAALVRDVDERIEKLDAESVKEATRKATRRRKAAPAESAEVKRVA